MELLRPQAGFPSLPFSTKMKQNWIKKGQNVRRSKWQKWHIRYQELTHVTLPPRKDNVPSFGTTLTDEGLRDLAYNGPNTKNPTTMVDQAIAVKCLEFQLWHKSSLMKKMKMKFQIWYEWSLTKKINKLIKNRHYQQYRIHKRTYTKQNLIRTFTDVENSMKNTIWW